MTKRVLTALMAVALLCTMLPAMALANTGSMYVQTSNGGSVHLRKDPIAPANNVLTDVPYGGCAELSFRPQLGTCGLYQRGPHMGRLYDDPLPGGAEAQKQKQHQ